jgi:hypothetical protein
MRRGAAFWLAWSLAGISVAMFIAGFVFALLALNIADPVRRTSTGGIGGVLVFLPFLAFPIVGALVASKRPENPIGWICLTAGLFWMLIVVGDPMMAYGLARTGSPPGPVMLDALTQSTWAPRWGYWVRLWSCCSRMGGCPRAGGVRWPGSRGRRYCW